MRFSLSASIYKLLIDPILASGQKHIISRIRESDRVLDIACGTGSLSASMGRTADEVVGIDLSDEMIEIAKKSAVRKGLDNVSFNIADASDLSNYGNNSFDIAVTSMAIHQFDAELAVEILKEMSRIAKRVIIMDYHYPMRYGFTRTGVYLVEWIAGGDHYRNFRRYNSLGGLDQFINNSGLRIISDSHPLQAFRIVECSLVDKD